MIHELIQKFKVEITMKEILMWFGLSFIGIFAVFLIPLHRELNSLLFIEIFAYALVFVVIMAMTKSYSHYIDTYYQSYIDRHEVKNKKSHKKKKRKS